MKKSLMNLVMLTAFVVAIAATGKSARADGNYGAFVIENPTDFTIHYQVRWGDGDWKPFCVEPGRAMSHYYPLTSEDCAPPPQVRFDYVVADDELSWKTLHVEFFATDCPDHGKLYAFRLSACGCYLGLYSE
jgi:hypothetical protein